MRPAFINALHKLARSNDRIFLLSADVGFSVFERFIEDFPDRYFNVGVAEANMIGVASGLSLSNKIVYVYTMAHFITMRCYEQIRLDICYQNTNVKLIGSGGGLTYGSAGITHHSIEDISIMRSLPNMYVVCPGDPIETEYLIEASLKHKGPMYVRLGKRDPIIHRKDIDFKIGKGLIIKRGDDLHILSTGNMLETAMIVSGNLERNGLNASVVSMHTVKPIDINLIKELADTGKPIFTIEEHSMIGGLGSAVSEILAELDCNIPFKKIGLPDEYCPIVGSQKYLRKTLGLDVDSIYKIIKEASRSKS